VRCELELEEAYVRATDPPFAFAGE
jgi:hypothetical protein